MIKTIDTRNITTAMLKAQDVIDGTTYSDPLSFKDAADIFIAMTEAAPAVEPAQAVPVAWLPIETAPKDGTEILVTYGKQGFVMQLVRFDRTFNYWKNKGEAELGLENNATHWMPIPDPRKPLYTAPPAINQEIVYQVWRSTDSCEECWSWDDCDKEDYDKAHPTARRMVVILDEC